MQITSIPKGFPVGARVSMPCPACGSALAPDGNFYCPACQRAIESEERIAAIFHARMSYLDYLEGQIESRQAA